MNLNEFSTKDLEYLKEILDDKVSLYRKLIDTTRIDRTKLKYANKVDYCELLKVKINNHLGKFD
jgi:hypothetical protein